MILQARKLRPNPAIPTPAPNTHRHLKHSPVRKPEICFKKKTPNPQCDMKTSTNPNATYPEVGFICCQVSKPLGLPADNVTLLSFNSNQNAAVPFLWQDFRQMKTLCLCLHTKGSLTGDMENGKSAGSPSHQTHSSAGIWQHREPSGSTSPGTLLRASPALQGGSRTGKGE